MLVDVWMVQREKRGVGGSDVEQRGERMEETRGNMRRVSYRAEHLSL